MRKDKYDFIGWYNTFIRYPSNKKVEFKFMKEIKPGYYSSMPEMVAELKAKIPSEHKTINFHSDGFDIYFDYDSFSNKSIVTISHGVPIKMGFKENEILHGPTPIVSPFMENMEGYTVLYVYTDVIQNQLVGNVRAPLLRVVPVRSRYGDTTRVTYEQPQFLPLSRSTIHTVEINIRSDTGELVSKSSTSKRLWYWWYLQKVDKNVVKML